MFVYICEQLSCVLNSITDDTRTHQEDADDDTIGQTQDGQFSDNYANEYANRDPYTSLAYVNCDKNY